jgi:hypothetical protein
MMILVPELDLHGSVAIAACRVGADDWPVFEVAMNLEEVLKVTPHLIERHWRVMRDLLSSNMIPSNPALEGLS